MAKEKQIPEVDIVVDEAAGVIREVKPEKILRFFIETLTNEGDTVLDTFMGSGATGVAACQLGRKFIGIELDQVYFDNAKKRIMDTK